MGNLMDSGFHRLDFAHAVLNGNAVFYMREVAFCSTGNVLEGDRDGRFLLESFKKGSVVFHAAGQFINCNVREFLAVCLRDIEDAYHLKGRTHDLHSLRDGLAVCIQHRLLSCRINLFTLFLSLVGRRSKYLDTFLTLHDMTVKVALP